MKHDYVVMGIVVIVAALALTSIAYPVLVTYVRGLSPEVECMINNGCYVESISNYSGGLIYDNSGNYLGKLADLKCIPRKGYAKVSNKVILNCTELTLIEGEVEGIEAVEAQ